MQKFHDQFISSSKKHILMLSTHGVHEWNVVPGLTDTGGQNVFVNLFTSELVHQGYKVTIANRGGYPHPVTGKQRKGVDYGGAFQRILYLEDDQPEFIRKEDMGSQIDHLTAFLADFLAQEGLSVDLLISHYWDAAAVGEGYKKNQNSALTHIWVPHSLGAIKKRNVDESKWEALQIDERIAYEREIIANIDFGASTSPAITDSFQQDYGYLKDLLWLPPCISTARYYPHNVPENAEAWGLLQEVTGLSLEKLHQMKIITEISRTDTTKRKSVLIRAFAKVLKEHPETLLVVTIDTEKEPLGPSLVGMAQDLGIEKNVAILGSVWDLLPDLYAISDIYCTPSIMEGFGMSAQEAAATEVPVVASALVPYAVQYLHPDAVPDVTGSQLYSIGEGAIIVQPDSVEGFWQALSKLLSDDQLRINMGKKAYQLTIPRFTWSPVVEEFLRQTL